MPTVLHYGVDSTITLDLPSGVLVAECDGPRGDPLDDPAAAVAAVLGEPLQFPSIREATVPGDRVVVALDRGVPQAPALVEGVVRALLGGSTQPEDITVVRPKEDVESGREDPRSLLPREIREAVRLVTHDPADRERLAYLAASEDARPIYVNRTIFDADLVLPIGLLRPEASLGYVGMHSGLFPTFADEEAQRRFLAPSSVASPVQHRRRCSEVKEAAWLLGIQFTIQVVPGAGSSVLHVLAGIADAVLSRGGQLCESAWALDIPRRASLVVATIVGGRDQQTWENFARALSAAQRVVAEDGAIAVCSDIDSDPGSALGRLAVADSPAEALREIRKDRTSDAMPASQLAQTLDHSKVYLLSRLAEDVVEDLGVAYVGSGDDIVRLSSRHASCITLSNAQHAMPTLIEPEADQSNPGIS